MLGRRGRDPEPVPPALDDLAVGADRDPAAVLGEPQPVVDHVAGHGGLPLAGEPDGERRARRRLPALHGERLPVEDEAHAARVPSPEDLGQRRIEQRLEVTAQRGLDEAGVEERRERARQSESHRRAPRSGLPRRRDPLPRGPVTGGQAPAGCHVVLAGAGFGQHLLAHEQADLDADAGEADALSSDFGAGRDVVIARQLATAHPGAVVHDGERGDRGIGRDRDGRRSRVERVGYDLDQDGLLRGPGVRVPQVLEEVEQIDAGLAHVSASARRGGGRGRGRGGSRR